MKLVGIGRAQAQLSGLVARAQKERIVLTRHGEPVALLLGVKGRDLEELLLTQDPAFRTLIQRRRSDDAAPVSHDALLAEAKAEGVSKKSSTSKRRRREAP